MKRNLTDFLKQKPLFNQISRHNYLIPMAWLGALVATTFPAMKILLATTYLLAISNFPSQTQLSLKSEPTKIQAFYLSYGVYVPISDIFELPFRDLTRQHLVLLEERCGAINGHIWIPLRLHFPLFGTRVLEWCLVNV